MDRQTEVNTCIYTYKFIYVIYMKYIIHNTYLHIYIYIYIAYIYIRYILHILSFLLLKTSSDASIDDCEIVNYIVKSLQRDIYFLFLFIYYLYLQMVKRSKTTNKNQLPSKSNLRISR